MTRMDHALQTFYSFNCSSYNVLISLNGLKLTFLSGVNETSNHFINYSSFLLLIFDVFNDLFSRLEFFIKHLGKPKYSADLN